MWTLLVKKIFGHPLELTSESYVDINFLNSAWRTEFEIDIEHAKAIFCRILIELWSWFERDWYP